MSPDALDATPDLPAIEERCRRLWDETAIHRFDPAGDGETFSVDTPPPYVSAAHLHVGHAMSYVQAELIVRYQRMRGRRVFYPMGFDDNGLPTERYVERKHGIDKQATTRHEFRELCMTETRATTEVYEQLWRALGLSVDWELGYSTIDDRCRVAAQRSFIEAWRAGRVYRSDDPVFWDTQLRTALAQADLESIERSAQLYDIAFGDLTISTTRPELLPACVALYCHPGDERYNRLIGAIVTVPIFGQAVPVRADDEVEPEFGTGLLMVCTFGDAEDVRRWRNDRLATRLCIDEDGRLDWQAGRYAGLTVEEARRQIVTDLGPALRGQRKIDQRVAVSERSGAPVEFVMRPQWFLRVLDLKDELLRRSEEIEWHPPWMRQRLVDWIEGLRYDWNLSRQRYYGVPFPVWLCRSCGAAVVADEERLPVDPLEDAPPTARCSTCWGELAGDPDVMDTWMTSSMTPQIVSGWDGLPMSLRVQAHDIIRTWLFYTLLKGHLHADSVPWKNVMISGWGLDEHGRRLSKRHLESGRYDPHDVIARYGADALRHWAARAQLGQDVRYNERDVRAGRKVVLKLWNIARFCQRHMVAGELTDLMPEDRWLVWRVDEATARITAALGDYDYADARQAADDLLWTLADDWLEITKDRIWNPDRYTGDERRSAAVTMHHAIRRLVALYAPILPFVTEEIYQRIFAAEEPWPSLHVSSWPATIDGAAPVPEMDAILTILHAVRALRTEQGLSQTADLTEVTVQAEDDLLRRLYLMQATVQAACRARSVVFTEAPAGTGAGSPSVWILP